MWEETYRNITLTENDRVAILAHISWMVRGKFV